MRIVDTRSSFVDLSKYDEALNKYVSEREETVVVKQKLKKQNNRRISNKERDKERRALEKLRKEEIERERRRKLTIQIPDAISVGELASRLKISASEVIKKLVLNGIMASISDVIDFDTAYLITEELGVKAEREVVVTIEEKLLMKQKTQTKISSNAALSFASWATLTMAKHHSLTLYAIQM